MWVGVCGCGGKHGHNHQRTLRQVVEVLAHHEHVVALASTCRVEYAALHARTKAAKRRPLRIHAIVRNVHDRLNIERTVAAQISSFNVYQGDTETSKTTSSRIIPNVKVC